MADEKRDQPAVKNTVKIGPDGTQSFEQTSSGDGASGALGGAYAHASGKTAAALSPWGTAIAEAVGRIEDKVLRGEAEKAWSSYLESRDGLKDEATEDADKLLRECVERLSRMDTSKANLEWVKDVGRTIGAVAKGAAAAAWAGIDQMLGLNVLSEIAKFLK